MKSKAKKPPTRTGVCRICGCTEDRACDVGLGDGCWWVDKSKTLCSACAPWWERATAAFSRKGPWDVELWGLWIMDQGPEQRGRWLLETIDPTDSNRTRIAVFESKDLALEAGRNELDAGLDVIAVRLIATSMRLDPRSGRRAS